MYIEALSFLCVVPTHVVKKGKLPKLIVSKKVGRPAGSLVEANGRYLKVISVNFYCNIRLFMYYR